MPSSPPEQGSSRCPKELDEVHYTAAKEGPLSGKLVAAGRGRGGSLYRVVESDLVLKSPEPNPLKEKKPKADKRASRGGRRSTRSCGA